MAKVFVDTSVYVAFFNEKDTLHARARKVMDRIASEKPVLSEYVLDELLNVLTRRQNKRLSVKAGEQVQETALMALTSGSELRDAWQLFSEPNSLSFTDAMLVVQARTHGAQIATFDKEFEKVEGIDVLQ